MTTKKHFDLLTNAQDSLAHAINHIVEDKSPSKWKIAVREVTHVIELILKERLRREHPAFLWVKVEDLNNPDKNTLTLDGTQARLDKICQVRLTPGASRTLALCKQLRNKIEHFEFQLDEAGARAIVARLVSFIFSFTAQHLKVDWEKEFREDDRWKTLIEIKEFVSEHEKVLQERLAMDSISTAECPACCSSVFNLDTEKCELCGHEEAQVECCNCRNCVWESDAELTPVDEDGNLEYVCTNCIENAPYEYEPDDSYHDDEE